MSSARILPAALAPGLWLSVALIALLPAPLLGATRDPDSLPSQLPRSVDGSIETVSLIGAEGTDIGQSVAAGPRGDVYVAGSTTSRRFGAQRNAGATDILLVKQGGSSAGWTRLLGGPRWDVGYGVAVASDGSVYVTGWTESPHLGGQNNAGGADIVLAKYSATGTRLWTRLLGSVDREEARDVAVARDGSIYLTGFTSRGDSDTLADQDKLGDLDIVLAKYAPSGQRLWTRLLGGSSQDVGYGVAVSKGGSVYLTGSSRGIPGQPSVASGDDIILARYSSSGRQVWATLAGGSLIDEGHGVAVSGAGAVYVSGLWGGALDAGHGDVVVARYDATGAIEWQRLLSGSQLDMAEGVTVDRDGSIYVAGWTWSPTIAGQSNSGATDVVIARYNPAGARLSVDLLGGASVELGHGVAPGGGASAYVAGESASATLAGQVGHGETDVVLARYRP